MPDPCQDLVDAIAFALARKQRSLPKPGRRETGWGPAIDEFRIVAQAIVRHLELCGFRLERKPPAEGHRTP